MRTVALISGGKDSCYNMMQCIGAGHKIVALANLQPMQKDELDSYMYQTVGHHGIDLYADAMGLPLYREFITGSAVDQGRNYSPTEHDEVEDLYRLLSRIKDDLDIEAVASGAILSDYQRIRVENVCKRLGLVSLAYLWRRNQKELLQEMITNGVEAIIIKVAALGLDPRAHLGLSLAQMQPHLLRMRDKYGLNVCGEGGEYETFTLDCPLFKKRLVVDEKELVIHSEDPVAPVGYLNLKLHLEPKDNADDALILPPTVKSSLDFVSDLSDTVFSDLSDIELSETELESIEKIEKEEKKKLDLLTNNDKSEVSPSLDVTDNLNESGDSFEDGYSYEEEHRQYEKHPIYDHRSIHGNRHGWYFIGGIVGEGVDMRVATDDAMKKLITLLESHEMTLPDVCSVNIYMRDMEEYAILNEVYVSHISFSNPPTRVCVQCPLPDDVGLILDAVAHKDVPSSPDTDNGSSKERVTMHVQSISHWAPANIGPYSQAVKVGEVIGTCGQIALVPGSMQLAAGGARRQCALALRHLTRVLRAAAARATVRSVVQSVCYVSAGSARACGEARRQLEARTAGAIAQLAVVAALPRGAALEWRAWAHTDNNRFDCECTRPSGPDIAQLAVVAALPRGAALEWRAWAHTDNNRFDCECTRPSGPDIAQLAVVAALPRGAALEWRAWAHTDNNRFDCECTRPSGPDIAQLAVVAALPRGAALEWRAWAHTDNNRFDCECTRPSGPDIAQLAVVAALPRGAALEWRAWAHTDNNRFDCECTRPSGPDIAQLAVVAALPRGAALEWRAWAHTDNNRFDCECTRPSGPDIAQLAVVAALPRGAALEWRAWAHTDNNRFDCECTRPSGPDIAQLAVVAALPRGAALEWRAWAHTDNNRFDCECTRPSGPDIAQLAVVAALPRGAALEWRAWAHTDNNRFDCECTRPSGPDIAQLAVVAALPRGAALEWRAWAHTDNNRFDCECTRPSGPDIAQLAVVAALPRGAALEWRAWAHTDNNRFDCECTRPSGPDIAQLAVVAALPRGAALEWRAWAHTDNNRFDYEETGCSIGEYKVAIARRWNYENTVAAFVCSVSTGSSPSSCQLSFPSEEACQAHRARAALMPQTAVEQVLHYALRKLNDNCPEPCPAVKMTIFYQVWSAPPASVLSAAAAVACPRAAVSTVPVLALHNAGTFLSLSGLRLDE